MVNPQIVNYIRQYSGQYSIQQIRQGLINQGHNPNEVNEAISAVTGGAGQQTDQQQPSGFTIDKNYFFDLDDRTKETAVNSVLAMVGAQVVVFIGSIITKEIDIFGIGIPLVIAVVSGIISGYLASKIYPIIKSKANLSFMIFLLISSIIVSVIIIIFKMIIGSMPENGFIKIVSILIGAAVYSWFLNFQVGEKHYKG